MTTPIDYLAFVEKLKARRTPTTRPKATLAELEAILNCPGSPPVTINPDGSITTEPGEDALLLEVEAALQAAHAMQARVAELERRLTEYDEEEAERRHACDEAFKCGDEQ